MAKSLNEHVAKVTKSKPLTYIETVSSGATLDGGGGSDWVPAGNWKGRITTLEPYSKGKGKPTSIKVVMTITDGHESAVGLTNTKYFGIPKAPDDANAEILEKLLLSIGSHKGAKGGPPEGKPMRLDFEKHLGADVSWRTKPQKDNPHFCEVAWFISADEFERKPGPIPGASWERPENLEDDSSPKRRRADDEEPEAEESEDTGGDDTGGDDDMPW